MQCRTYYLKSERVCLHRFHIELVYIARQLSDGRDTIIHYMR